MIETVITPKEGCKLSVHSSKVPGQEEYVVDSVEVVSFGRAHFFRSLEKPKPFLVPVTDYEIVEVKEARMVLKGVGFEKSIKIGGGREALREVPEEKVSPQQGEEGVAQEEPQPSVTPYQEKKRGKRYRRKGHHPRDESFTPQPQSQESPAIAESSEAKKEAEAAPVVVRKLIPPPSTLIKEKLARIKGALDEELFPANEVTLSEGESLKVEEKIEEKKEPEEEFPSFNQDQID